jgi:hypothetical protein
LLPALRDVNLSSANPDGMGLEPAVEPGKIGVMPDSPGFLLGIENKAIIPNLGFIDRWFIHIFVLNKIIANFVSDLLCLLLYKNRHLKPKIKCDTEK